MEREPKKVEGRKWLILAGGALIILVMMIVGSLISSLGNSDGAVDVDDGLTIDDAGGDRPYLYFANLTYLESIMGVDFGANYTKGLSSSLLESVDISKNSPGAGYPQTAYVIRIDNSSVQEKVSFPFSIYSFNFSVSDGREYKADFAVNGDLYAGMLLYKTKPLSENASLYITFDENDAGAYNRDEVIKSLISWAKSLYPEGVIVMTGN